MKTYANLPLAVMVMVVLIVSASLAQAQEKALLTVADCKQAVGYVAGADARYQPGVDVNGNAVVPAEGDGPGPVELKLPTEIVIDFGLDLAGRYGISGAGLDTATTKIFKIKYDLDAGALTINGKPLNREDARATKRACALLLQKKGD